MEAAEASLVASALKAFTPKPEELKTREITEAYLRSVLLRVLDPSVIIKTFGSGPLKTNLPRSDIDLVVLYKDRLLAGEPPEQRFEISTPELAAIKECLEEEGGKMGKISELTVINADVKLIKLSCNGIPVDISFNQAGGICTLGLLEELSARFAKDHLFKKSIILIKAWATHEGRILGSHLGCMATHALQVLIGYVLNAHYAELQTPLDVFFKFFEVFGKFDWDKQVLSMFGPIYREGFYDLL